MEKDNQLLEKISLAIFRYMEKEGTDTPNDEYHPEAKNILENLPDDWNAAGHSLARVICKTFNEAYDHDYTEDQFFELEKKVKQILSRKL